MKQIFDVVPEPLKPAALKLDLDTYTKEALDLVGDGPQLDRALAAYAEADSLYEQRHEVYSAIVKLSPDRQAALLKHCSKMFDFMATYYVTHRRPIKGVMLSRLNNRRWNKYVGKELNLLEVLKYLCESCETAFEWHQSELGGHIFIPKMAVRYVETELKKDLAEFVRNSDLKGPIVLRHQLLKVEPIKI